MHCLMSVRTGGESGGSLYNGTDVNAIIVNERILAANKHKRVSHLGQRKRRVL